MPVSVLAPLSRSRPVVSQVLHWPCKGAGQAVVLVWPGIEIEQGHCLVACHHLGLEAQGQSGRDCHCSEGAGVTAQTHCPQWDSAIDVNELKNVPKSFQVT